MRKKRQLLVIPLLLLTGCAAAAGSCDLIPLKVYEPSFSESLAAEVDGLSNGSPLGEALADYIDLRARVRACQGGEQSYR